MNTIGIVAEAMQTEASTRRRRPRSGSGGLPGEAGEKIGASEDSWDMVEERPKAAQECETAKKGRRKPRHQAVPGPM
ncbi:hypothetical protein [Paracidovorax cattleyae]|uniref:hypothetical protein n=1 Tax=Paracidovorax cattleyae TaxID=80868 RepID=UPI0012602805|nr:hypothetical protein [Paracidovorax cattleyae]